MTGPNSKPDDLNMDLEKDPEKDKGAQENKETERDLTPNEAKRVARKEISIPQIVANRNQKAKETESNLNHFVKTKIVSEKDYLSLKKQMEGIKSEEKMKAFLEGVKELPKQKADLDKKNKEEAKERSPEDPEMKELQKKFESICDNNKDLIGTKEVPGFKAWYREEIRKTPSIAQAKEIIRRLEGKEVTDRGGLAPRRAEFINLQNLFKRNKLGSPLSNDYIRREGLSERQTFRKNAESLEDHFQKVKDTGFYSPEMIQKTMKKMLEARSLGEQNKLLSEAQKIAKKESENFIYLESKITIEGTTIRKMSKASQDQLMTYYKNADYKDRLKTDWKKLVEYEADLANELGKIYKNDKEGLKLALESFGELDFLAKQEDLKNHKKIKEKNDSAEKQRKQLIITAAETKISEAARNKYLSEKTKNRYIDFFRNDENFRNPKNKQPGDIDELEKGYEILKDPKPNDKYKNLAAYEKRYKIFTKDLDELADTHPTIDKKEIKKWKENYEKEGWSKRTKIHETLRSEITKAKQERKKQQGLEEEIGLTNDEKKENKEKNLNLDETIKTANELLQDNQGAEALKLLLAYNENDPDNPKILFWIETVSKYMREFGSGKKIQSTQEKQLEEEMDSIVKSDETIKDELEEQQIKTLNQEGAKQSEDRHDKNTDARERAKKDSLSQTEDGSLEEDLTKSYYEQTDNQHILNKEKTGEEVEEISYSEHSIDDQSLQTLKEKTKEQQAKLDTKEGFDIQLKDENGRNISSEEAQAQQEKNLAELEDNLAEKATKKAEGKSKDSVFDIHSKMAAKRKARELIDKKRHQKIKQAA